jgi:hypothetical protein
MPNCRGFGRTLTFSLSPPECSELLEQKQLGSLQWRLTFLRTATGRAGSVEYMAVS